MKHPPGTVRTTMNLPLTTVEQLRRIADMLPREQQNRTAAVVYLAEIAEKQLSSPNDPKKKGKKS